MTKRATRLGTGFDRLREATQSGASTDEEQTDGERLQAEILRQIDQLCPTARILFDAIEDEVGE